MKYLSAFAVIMHTVWLPDYVNDPLKSQTLTTHTVGQPDATPELSPRNKFNPITSISADLHSLAISQYIDFKIWLRVFITSVELPCHSYQNWPPFIRALSSYFLIINLKFINPLGRSLIQGQRSIHLLCPWATEFPELNTPL